MRVFFVVYALAVIGFLYLQQFDSLLARLALWGHIALWVGGLIMVPLRMAWSSWVGLAAMVPLIGILLVHSGLYVAFIVEHRGLDCATCNGSPMALILSWAVELVLLIPGIVLCLWLARTLRRARSRTN